ncbi:MAG: DUF2141 domain-containing protein [Alphaproteobacteria bacterium]
MKKSLLTGLAAAALMATTLPAGAATLTVVAENVKKAKGKVIVAVYEEDKFLSDEEGAQIYTAAVPAEKGPVTLTIKDVKPGTYGFVIFHDANSNNDLDRNFIGLPKEGIGFSNGAKINMAPPKFEDARFDVDQEGATQAIALDY